MRTINGGRRSMITVALAILGLAAKVASQACTCDTSTWVNVDSGRFNRPPRVICGQCTVEAQISSYGTCAAYCAAQEGGRLECSRAWNDGPHPTEWNNYCTAAPVLNATGQTLYGQDWGCTHTFTNTDDALCECRVRNATENCTSAVLEPTDCPPIQHAVGDTSCNGYGRGQIGDCVAGYYKSQGTGPHRSDECLPCSPPCNVTSYAVTTCNDPSTHQSQWTVDTTCSPCTLQNNCLTVEDACAYTRRATTSPYHWFRRCSAAHPGFYIDRITNLTTACPANCPTCESYSGSSVACNTTSCAEVPRCTSCSTGYESWRGYGCRLSSEVAADTTNRVSTPEALRDAIATAPTDGTLTVVTVIADINLAPLCYNASNTCNALTVPPGANIELNGEGQRILDGQGGFAAARRIVYVQDAQLVVRNITFTHGSIARPNGSPFSSDGDGGAVYLYRLARAEFYGCIFEYNYVSSSGGAVGITGQFIHGPNLGPNVVQVTFVDCLFRFNNASGVGVGNGGGGAAGITGARATFYRTTFEGNAAGTGRGGAVFASSTYYNGGTQLNFFECNFTGCLGSQGSAIKLYRGPNSLGTSAVVAHSWFNLDNVQPEINVDNSRDSAVFGMTALYLFNNTYASQDLSGTCPYQACCNGGYQPCCNACSPPDPTDFRSRVANESNVYTTLSSLPVGYYATATSVGICPADSYCSGGGQRTLCPAGLTSNEGSGTITDCRSAALTQAPSAVPTFTAPTSPSSPARPTASPSRRATATPSHVPTDAPSTQSPSASPSQRATATPSHAPTDVPSTQSPSASPTSVPTRQPSAAPSSEPTDSPTTRPGSPTAAPTSPTSVPTTLAPTATPVVSIAPTPAPTAPTAPTAPPSAVPTSPTTRPTTPPTTPIPSVAPSTVVPTSVPSTPPPSTAFPTVSPTLQQTTVSSTTVSPTTDNLTSSAGSADDSNSNTDGVFVLLYVLIGAIVVVATALLVRRYRGLTGRTRSAIESTRPVFVNSVYDESAAAVYTSEQVEPAVMATTEMDSTDI